MSLTHKCSAEQYKANMPFLLLFYFSKSKCNIHNQDAWYMYKYKVQQEIETWHARIESNVMLTIAMDKHNKEKIGLLMPLLSHWKNYTDSHVTCTWYWICFKCTFIICMSCDIQCNLIWGRIDIIIITKEYCITVAI